MKVLLIDVNCKNSSTGKIVYDLYSAVNASGGKAAVCYGRGEKIKEENIYKFGIDLETAAHALLTRITGFTGCFSPLSTYRLIRFIKKFKPDVIHIHELHAYFVNIKPLLKFIKKNNIKTVFTHHCEFMYTGKCGHSVECEKWQNECGNCPRLKDYPSSLFFDWTGYMFRQKKELMTNLSNTVMSAPSNWLAKRIEKSFLSSHEIKVVHNGIDTNVFFLHDTDKLRKEHNIEQDEKVVLALAPDLMSNNKGGKFVLSLADKMKDKKVRFILVGVDEIFEPQSSNVIVLGRIYDKELLAQYYSLADVFVICSERENYPTTCLEAQCCGAVVCGFDTGGVKETFLEQFRENCVEYGDVSALESVVCKALEKDSCRNLISKTAIEKFDKSNMVKAYLDIY